MRVSVLGGGHGCYAAAAELSERGHEVWMWRRDTAAFEPLLRTGVITVRDHAGERGVKVAHPTDSLEEAVRAAEVIVAPVPAVAHEELACAVAPYLSDGQVVFMPPGTFGSVVFARAALEAGNTSQVSFAETGTLPYLVRKHGPAEIVISAYATRLPTGVFPASRSNSALSKLQKVFPAVEPVEDALSGALMNAGPIIHPPLILMNAGPLEHWSRGSGDVPAGGFLAWDIHNEGTQPSIRAVTTALDHERIMLREALGYRAPHFPLSDHYAADGDEWMYGRAAHERLTDSGDWREKIDLRNHRYMREDVVLGLGLLVSVARWARCATPIANGLLSIASAVVGQDLYAKGRTLEALGLSDLTRTQMTELLRHGLPV